MTLIVPTNYRRAAIRECENPKRLSQGRPLICLRCFNEATVGLRCDNCRADRKIRNIGRKR